MTINFIKEFVEANYEQFQEFLEEVYEVEGSEAEIILDEMEILYKALTLTLTRPAKAIDRKFSFLAVNPSNGKVFTESEGLILLAKDTLVPATLKFYLSQVCEHIGETSVEAKGIRMLIDRVMAWREAHIDQCKLPDIIGEKEIRAVLGCEAIGMHHSI